MPADTIDLVPFTPDHLVEAARLSQEANWPHRLEDWQMCLALSRGIVAQQPDGRMIGTAFVTPYATSATINMVIVAEQARGRGIGRQLMIKAIEVADEAQLRLVATADGLPLYEKLGFRRTGQIEQYQGIVKPVSATASATRAATADDLLAIARLDRIAFSADRADLLAMIQRVGNFVVLMRNNAVAGFAGLRAFGRGEVIGPVVAVDLADAQAMVLHLAASRTNRFLRIDTNAATELGPWLADLGLALAGGGIAMQRPPSPASAPSPVSTFALASQAFG